MDAKRAEMKDGLSKEADNLQDHWNFLHPGYRVEHGSCKWVGTGPLEILKIICIDDERLFFRGRWDPARRTQLTTPSTSTCSSRRDEERGLQVWQGRMVRPPHDEAGASPRYPDF